MSAHQDQPITLYRGESWLGEFTAGTPTAITGWALTFTLSTLPGETATLTLTTADGVAITGAGTGVFTVALTQAQTAALSADPGLYSWDVWRTDSGSRARLAGGLLTVLEPVRAAS